MLRLWALDTVDHTHMRNHEINFAFLILNQIVDSWLISINNDNFLDAPKGPMFATNDLPKNSKECGYYLERLIELIQWLLPKR